MKHSVYHYHNCKFKTPIKKLSESIQTFLIYLPVLQANSRVGIQMALPTLIVSDVTTNAAHTLTHLNCIYCGYKPIAEP